MGYKEKLNLVDDAILANAAFLNQIVANPEIFGHDVDDEDGAVESLEPVGHSHSHDTGPSGSIRTVNIHLRT